MTERASGLRGRLRGTGLLSASGLLFALLAGSTGVAGSYAVAGYSRRFVVAPIDATVVETRGNTAVLYR